MRKRGRSFRQSSISARTIVSLSLLMGVSAVVALWIRGPGGRYASPRCGIETKRIIVAPHEMRQLVIYESDCDELGLTTQISVTPAGSKFRPDAHPPLFGVKGSTSLSVKWVTDSEVEIVVPQAEVIRKEAQAHSEDVKITYR